MAQEVQEVQALDPDEEVVRLFILTLLYLKQAKQPFKGVLHVKYFVAAERLSNQLRNSLLILCSVTCEQKAIKDAYHVMCNKCAGEKNVCAKCQESREIVPTNIKTEKEIIAEQVELERLLSGMNERERRSYIRQMERKAKKGEDDEDEEGEDEEGEDEDEDEDGSDDDDEDDSDEDSDEDEDSEDEKKK